MDPILIISLVSFTVMAGALASRPLGRWVKKVKRRKGGVYGYRVRHHSKPMRRHWGYIGETVSFYFRDRQHMGTSNYAPAGGKRLAVAQKVPAQPWSDLDPVRHVIVALPWWLCWKWILRPLETLVMAFTWPVYNDAKNHWNPRRVPKGLAQRQRHARDAGGTWASARVTAARAGRIALQVAGAVLVLVGTYGWVVTR
jgi:hypothetical protein